MEPADSIIQKLGGPSEVAKIVGVHRTRVSNWKRPRNRGGTGGRVPQNHIPALLAYARDNGIGLGPADFIPAAADSPAEANSNGASA
jgi:hypothetical protein